MGIIAGIKRREQRESTAARDAISGIDPRIRLVYKPALRQSPEEDATRAVEATERTDVSPPSGWGTWTRKEERES